MKHSNSPLHHGFQAQFAQCIAQTIWSGSIFSSKNFHAGWYQRAQSWYIVVYGRVRVMVGYCKSLNFCAKYISAKNIVFNMMHAVHLQKQFAKCL